MSLILAIYREVGSLHNVLAFAVVTALIFQVPQGFVDRTAEGKRALGPLAGKVTLPARATVKQIAVEERDGRVHAASWAYTLPLSGAPGPDFVDGLAKGLNELGTKAPATDLNVRGQRNLKVQGTDGGRVDVDLTVDEQRMREIIYYAPSDDGVAVVVYLAPLAEMNRYEPLFTAAVQAQPPPQRRFPWDRVLEIAAVIAFVLALLGARAARKRMQAR
jgi:hypothetical protein